MMRRFVAIGALLSIGALVPVVASRAGADANGDGCVDLRDYAELQSGFTGPNCSPASRASFYAEGQGDVTLIPSVPGTAGFVITDILVRGTSNSASVTLKEDDGIDETIKAKLWIGSQGESFRFQSGLPVMAGTRLAFDSGAATVGVTLSGFTY